MRLNMFTSKKTDDQHQKLPPKRKISLPEYGGFVSRPLEVHSPTTTLKSGHHASNETLWNSAMAMRDRPLPEPPQTNVPTPAARTPGGGTAGGKTISSRTPPNELDERVLSEIKPKQGTRKFVRPTVQTIPANNTMSEPGSAGNSRPSSDEARPASPPPASLIRRKGSLPMNTCRPQSKEEYEPIMAEVDDLSNGLHDSIYTDTEEIGIQTKSRPDSLLSLEQAPDVPTPKSKNANPALAGHHLNVTPASPTPVGHNLHSKPVPPIPEDNHLPEEQDEKYENICKYVKYKTYTSLAEIPKDINTLTTEQMAAGLKLIGLTEPQLDVFRREEIDNELIHYLSENALREMGLTYLQACRVIAFVHGWRKTANTDHS